MRYTQLRSFHAVAREGSFSAAAHKLRLSQPTLTVQIRALEAEYGTELFHRRNRKVALSEMGRALFSITNRLFSVEEEARELMESASELRTGQLRVGATGRFLIMKILERFKRQHPGVEAHVLNGNSEEVFQMVVNRDVDIGLFGYLEPDDRLYTISTHSHRLILLVHRDHAWATRNSISMRELHGKRMVFREKGSNAQRVFEGALAMNSVGVKPLVAMETDDRESFLEAVAQGIGMGVIGEHDFVPDPRIHVLKLADAGINVQTYLVCLQARRHTRLMRAITDIAQSLRPEIGPIAKGRPPRRARSS